MGAIQNRSVPMVIILSIITCGIYSWVWLYQVSAEINTALGDNDQAGMEVLFGIITCGIYVIYWWYKYDQKIQKLQGTCGLQASNNGILYIVLHIVGLFVVAMGIMQSQLNQLADGQL